MTPRLEIRTLGVQAHGKWLVRGVTTRIAAGSVFAVIGPNGAWFLAHADGRSVPEERAILDRIATVTNPSDALRAQLSNLAPAKGRSSALVESLRGLFRARA